MQLTNPSPLTNALNVNATISSSTAGVSVIQGTASYGNDRCQRQCEQRRHALHCGAGSGLNCGSPISLTLTATLTNGTQLVTPINVSVGSPVAGTISGTLSLAAPTGTGFYVKAAGTKTGTLARAGGQLDSVQTSRAHRPQALACASDDCWWPLRSAFTFTNSNAASQCVTVTGTSGTAANLQTATFNNSGFDAATSLGVLET